MRAQPARGFDHHPWSAAACLALVLFLWVGNCFGQAWSGPRAHPTLIETPYAPPGYVRLLKEYAVVVQGTPGVLDTRFDYQRLYGKRDQVALREDIRKRFLSVDPESLDPASLTAWAVNAYNFFVIDAVMDYITETTRYWVDSVSKIGEPEFAVFDEKRIRVGKTVYSLNGFERHFLFMDIDRASTQPPPPVDPRIHFVLNCGAMGCPPLRPEPLHPEHLDKDLDEAVQNALRTPRHLRFEGSTLHLSKIFEWYRVDFEGEGLREFLIRYAPPQVQRALQDPDRTIEIQTDIEWNWALNRP